MTLVTKGLTTDLLLNVLVSWLLVHLPSTFSLGRPLFLLSPGIHSFLLESESTQGYIMEKNLSNRQHIFCESQLHVSGTSSYPSSGSKHDYRVNVYSMMMTTFRWPKRVAVMCKIYSVYLSVSILYNPLNAELNPICHLLALLGAHHILHVSRIRVNLKRGRMPYLKEGRRTSEVQFNNVSV